MDGPQLDLAGKSHRAVSEFLVSQPLLDRCRGTPVPSRTERVSTLQVLLGYYCSTHCTGRPCSWDHWPRIPAATVIAAGAAASPRAQTAARRRRLFHPRFFQYGSPLYDSGAAVFRPRIGAGNAEFPGDAPDSCAFSGALMLACSDGCVLRS